MKVPRDIYCLSTSHPPLPPTRKEDKKSLEFYSIKETVISKRLEIYRCDSCDKALNLYI